jgi:hypothetical protein
VSVKDRYNNQEDRKNKLSSMGVMLRIEAYSHEQRRRAQEVE